MSKSTENRRRRIRRAKKNARIAVARTIAKLLKQIEDLTPAGVSKLFVAHSKQNITLGAPGTNERGEAETVLQQMYVFTTKIKTQRLAHLTETIATRVTQYHALESEHAVTSGHQATLLKQQMEQLLPPLCAHWHEFKEICHKSTGGQSGKHTNEVWLTSHCLARAGGRPQMALVHGVNTGTTDAPEQNLLATN